MDYSKPFAQSLQSSYEMASLSTIKESTNENIQMSLEDTKPGSEEPEIGLRRFRLTFQRNVDAWKEFGNVDNCRSSRSLQYTTDLKQTEDKVTIELIEVSEDEEEKLTETTDKMGKMSLETKESKGDLAKTLDMEEMKETYSSITGIHFENFIQHEKVKDAADQKKKIEEGISFRLNKIYYLRKLVNNLMLYWRSLEELIGVKPMDMVMLIGAFLKLQALLSKDLKHQVDECQRKS